MCVRIKNTLTVYSARVYLLPLEQIGRFYAKRPRIPTHFVQPDLNMRSVSNIDLIGALSGQIVGIVDPGPDPPAWTDFLIGHTAR